MALEEVSLGVHDLDAGDDGADVAEFSAGVHADAAADGAGDSGQAFDAGQALADGSEQQLLHIGARADFDEIAVELDAPPVIGVEPEDRAVDAAIVDQQICAQAQDVKVRIWDSAQRRAAS